jgi:predicted AAA+ superfamily ATPase
MMPFVGRQEELSILQGLTGNPLAVATITGRRRVGKSRLVTEYAQRENKKLIKIEGRDSPHAGNPMQLAAFAADLSRDTGITGFSFNNWNAAFNALGALARDKHWIILLDEITWLAKHSEECLAELKVFIDRYINGSGNGGGSQLIICGSVSQWIEQQINESDLFVGRISKKIHLAPLPLPDCAKFWRDREVSSREVLTALCVVGGVPRYLEEINVLESAEWNIQNQCFHPSGYMVHELPNLIKSSFINAAREHSLERYMAILAALSGHGKTLAEISAAIGVENNESLKNNLSALALSGIVSENPAWNLRNQTLNKRNLHYRIEDPYTRFYIKYIRPNINEIEKGLYRNVTLKQLPNWKAIRGFQFESLVNQCMIPTIVRKLRLAGVPILRSGPYFQKGTARRGAVQIDYLLQTDDVLYVCETKFRKRIEPSVIDEVREKIERLDTTPNMTIRRVLLYSGERANALANSIYFDHQICIDDLLRKSDD